MNAAAQNALGTAVQGIILLQSAVDAVIFKSD